jgi:Tfp pilus assembly protein PilF
MLDQARDDFDRAVKIAPDYARAYHMRGLISEKRGDDQTALTDFDRAIELNPDYGAAYYSRATLHAKMANTEKAQDDIEMVAQLGKRNMESFMNESNLWQTQHMRVEDAIGTELER